MNERANRFPKLPQPQSLKVLPCPNSGVYSQAMTCSTYRTACDRDRFGRWSFLESRVQELRCAASHVDLIEAGREGSANEQVVVAAVGWGVSEMKFARSERTSSVQVATGERKFSFLPSTDEEGGVAGALHSSCTRLATSVLPATGTQARAGSRSRREAGPRSLHSLRQWELSETSRLERRTAPVRIIAA